MRKAILFISLACLSFILIQKLTAPENRLINIYAHPQNLNPDEIKGDQCTVLLVQIQGTEIYVDSCYATFDEMLEAYEVNKDNSSLNFKKTIIMDRPFSSIASFPALKKLSQTSSKELKIMEQEITGYNCDYAYGFDIEIIEKDSRHLIQLKDIGNCLQPLSELLSDLKTEFYSLF